MKVDGKEMRPIWFDRASETVQVIDQRFLPHELIIEDLNTVDDVIRAIKEMVRQRGSPDRGHRSTGGLCEPGPGKQRWGGQPISGSRM
jgi:methylthioribose-1-phosphate isomerase